MNKCHLHSGQSNIELKKPECQSWSKSVKCSVAFPLRGCDVTGYLYVEFCNRWKKKIYTYDIFSNIFCCADNYIKLNICFKPVDSNLLTKKKNSVSYSLNKNCVSIPMSATRIYIGCQ
jgi:hypothetical protein